MKKYKYFSKQMLAVTTMLLIVMSICIIPSSAKANGGGTYDYVIITTSDIVENSQELDFFIHMKEINGHSVKIVTESDFEGLTGQFPNDRADKIRKWLQDYDGTYGIDYVLLIGDPDPDSFKESGDSIGDIPMKMCYPRYFGVGEGSPTDLYYSNLTSNWDLDGDGYYHESLEVTNPTSPDLSIGPDTFSVFWSGQVDCEFNVEYTFKVLSDDGVQLMIDGDYAIDNWGEHDLMYDEWTHTMEVGKHDISIFFRENYGDGIIKLYWSTAVDEEDPCYIKNTLIPSDRLYDADGFVGGLTGCYYNNNDLTDFKLTRVDPTIDFIWGTGDIGTSDPNYTPDVYVGRIPVYNNDYEQLDKILRKIINYETDPGDISWRHSVLLPMVETRDDTPGWGLGEAIKTDAAIASGSSYYRIYEPNSGLSPEAEVPPLEGDAIATVRDEWENGYGMVTWYAHGYPGGEAAQKVMNTTNVGALDDSHPSFTMQPSCFNAWPENPDNLAYSLLKNGAIATIASTRMTTFQFGAFASFNPVEYMAHQVSYFYTLYVMRDDRPAGVAYSEVVKNHKAPNANAIQYTLFGDPECQLFIVTPNEFPTANTKGPYTGDEGSPITFDASESSDPEGSTLEYRWDFDGDDTWDTDWSASPYAEFTWGDDYSGTVKLEVRDEIGKTDIAATTVTINNVAPTATFDSLGQTNPQFILPHQELIFTGTFTDPGWEDTHTATWDFDDTTVVAGDITEENDQPDSTGTITGSHSYSEPGTYEVKLTVTDDEDSSDIATTTVVVVTALEALQDLDDYIQNTANEEYKDKAITRKKAFSNKFNAIYKILKDEDYQKLIDKLFLDVRIKADGLIDGDPNDDWIMDYDSQYHICMKIDDITVYLGTL